MAPRPSARFVIAVVLLAAACSGRTTELEGDVVGVDAAGVTLLVAPSPDLGTVDAVRVTARPASLLADLHAGLRIRIGVARAGDVLVAVRVAVEGPSPAVAGLHDHGPRHGGVVSALGPIHAEIVPSPDGRIRVYLSDLHRSAVPLEGTTGTITLALPAGDRVLTLAVGGDALEATGAPSATEPVPATVELVRDGATLARRVLLDLTGRCAGVSQMPETGCRAPQDATEAGPRCTMTFPASFTALAVSLQGERATFSLSHGATSVWHLPDGTAAMGIDPLPPSVVAESAHEPDVRFLAPSRDGKRIAAAAGDEVVLFDGETGRLDRRLAGSGPTIRSLAWSADGRRLLTASADGAARLLDADTGTVVRTVPISGLLACALDASGRWAAATTGQGGLAIWDPSSDATPRVVTPSLQPIAALAFAGDRLVTAGTDRTLRVFDPSTASEVARVPLAAAAVALAVSPDGRGAAVADAERTITVHALPDGTITATLAAWHKAGIGILGWTAGPTIISGDNDGVLAVWDLPRAE
jgi:WD40 repeat protein